MRISVKLTPAVTLAANNHGKHGYEVDKYRYKKVNDVIRSSAAELQSMSSKPKNVRLVLMSEQNAELVAVLKQTMDGLALTKQPKGNMSIDLLLNKPSERETSKNQKNK